MEVPEPFAGRDEEANLTTVTMWRSEPLDDGRNRVTISEEGWRTESGLQSYYGCEGWTGALCAMKARVEHRIDPRHGCYP